MIFETIGVAAFTAFVTWQIAAKRFRIENVTQERTIWREKIRQLAKRVHNAMVSKDRDTARMQLNRLKNELRVRLNPIDAHDVEIIQRVSLPDKGCELHQAEEFASRISSLLKHDWERAKREASTLPFLRRKPKRETFLV